MLEPRYQDDMTTIYSGNCVEILRELEPVDAVVTDPPFFMPANHYQSRVNWQRRWADTTILGTFWGLVMDNIQLKKTGHCLVFCNHQSYPVFYPEMYCRFDYCKSLVWDKGHVGLGRVWRNQHELIIAARWKDAEFVADGKLRSDVLYHKATPSKHRKHPVEKPVSLLKDLIEPICIKDGIILDPFMGGGSTLIAARELGIKSIGIDADIKYCDIAIESLRGSK